MSGYNWVLIFLCLKYFALYGSKREKPFQLEDYEIQEAS